MGYKVTYSKLVVKSVLKYDKPTRERIYKAFDSLPFGDIRKLQGHECPPHFRLRIGNMRALFIKDDIKMEIFVFEIDSRGDIYK